MRKEKLRRIGSAAAAWLLVLGMVGCQKAPAEPTDDALLAVTTEATEPEVTRFVSTSRYQATLPPEPEKPTEPATQPTEPAVAEEEDTYYGDTSSDDSSSGSSGYTPAPMAPVDPAPVEPAPTEPAPVETAPPATEAPAVTLDYNAAAAYGNSYAASTYGWIVDSSVEGFYPASSVDVQYAIDNGGQSYINWRMTSVVDATAWMLSGDGSVFGVWCDCFESDGWIYFVVYYG